MGNKTMDFLEFSDGDKMPMLGLGTWKLSSSEAGTTVACALDLGYRHFDCAAVYGNEDEIGDALEESISAGKVCREDLWITSKLWSNAHLSNDVRVACKKTLKDLKLDYLDLYLIHWPIAYRSNVAFPRKSGDFLSYEEAPLEKTWEAMIKLKKSGLVKHIGVSNFNSAKLSLLMGQGQGREKEKPEVNQVEMHPYLPQEKLVSWCKDKNIQLTAYSPLGSPDRAENFKNHNEPSLLENMELKSIAEDLGVSVAQVLIAWSLHRKIAVIPKSSNPNRLKENIEAVKIQFNKDHLERINFLQNSNYWRFVDGKIWTKNGSPYSLSDLWEEELEK